MAERTVESEFGPHYEIPGFISFLVKNRYLNDMSWHNDANPSFGVDGIVKGTRNRPEGYETSETRVFVAHPIASWREGNGKRFIVAHSTSGGDWEDWQFDELEEMMEKLFEQIIAHWDDYESIPGVWSLLLDDSDEDPGEALAILLKKYYHP